MFKKILIYSCCLVTLPSFAMSTTKDTKVSASLNNSCTVSMSDVSFGQLPTNNINSPIIQDAPLNLRCNNNTSITISAIGSTNPQGNTGKYLTQVTIVTQNGDGVKAPGSLRYHLVADIVESNNNFDVVHKNSSIIKFWSGADYTLKLKVKTSQPFNVPLRSVINVDDFNNSRFSLKPGLYYDNVTLTLDY